MISMKNLAGLELIVDVELLISFTSFSDRCLIFASKSEFRTFRASTLDVTFEIDSCNLVWLSVMSFSVWSRFVVRTRRKLI